MGAVFALLFAPKAREELRLKIQCGVETNLEKANLELKRIKHTFEEKSKQPNLEESFPAPVAKVKKNSNRKGDLPMSDVPVQVIVAAFQDEEE